MSRRPPPALPPQSQDPVPVEQEYLQRHGGAWMVDAWTASLHFPSMSPPRLLPPCSAWATMVFVGHVPSSPRRSPTGFIPLWEFDDEQRLSQRMGPTANCSAAVLEAAPRDTSYGIATCRLKLGKEWTLLREETEQLAAAISDLGEIFLSRGLDIHMSIETGRCSLAMIESSNDDNELVDNDAEQTEISRKRPRNSLLVCLYCTKLAKQQVARDLQMDLIKFQKDLVKNCLSRGLDIHMNTETGRCTLATIESSDDDNELGDNDAEQTEISRKRPRNSSLVWLHFTKVLSKDSGMVTAMCKHCSNALKGASTLGTSHLLRHLKNVHQMNLSSLSEAWKETQRSSCSQKLQNTGSAACAGIPTPLTENNEKELQDKDFELGDTSRKRLKGTSRTKSDVWPHFTKLPSVDPGGVMAECNYCKKTLKADSQNGTSHLWRHFKKVHVEKAKSNYPN